MHPATRTHWEHFIIVKQLQKGKTVPVCETYIGQAWPRSAVKREQKKLDLHATEELDIFGLIVLKEFKGTISKTGLLCRFVCELLRHRVKCMHYLINNNQIVHVSIARQVQARL